MCLYASTILIDGVSCFSALYNFDTSVVSVDVLQQIYEVVSVLHQSFVHRLLTCVCTVGHRRGVEFDSRTRGVPAGSTSRQTRTVSVGAQRNSAFRRARRVPDIPVGLQWRPEQHSQQAEQPKGHGQGKWKCPLDEFVVKSHPLRRQGDRSRFSARP